MAKTPKVSKNTAWQAKALIGFFRTLSHFSLKHTHQIGRWLGQLLWWLPARISTPKCVTQLNIQQAFPHLSPSEQQQLVKASLINLGQTATELGAVWLKPEAEVHRWLQSAKNEHLLHEALEKGKGVMILAPHWGCWEMMAAYVKAVKPITYLYRPPNLPEMEDFMVQVRQRMGAKLVPTDIKGVRALTKALKRNELIGILPDQDPGPIGGIYAPFFGHPARTMTLAGKLAHKTGCVVLFLGIERLPDGAGYRPVWLPAPEAIASIDEQKATEALNQGVEQLILQNPTQYQWNYKRYRHPPEGVKDIYK